jgi:drug/metabolite transporter (DMT)-like permease
MRLKPTPLVETSVVFSIAWLVALILSVFITNDFNAALGLASAIALAYLMLSYSAWAVVGLIVKKKSYMVRFFWNLTVTSLISIAAPVFVDSQLHTEALTRNYILMSFVYFISSFVGALLTFFVITRPKKS